MSERTIQIGGHKIEISKADKVMYPQEGITKGDVADYYQKISETILPHTKDRPLNMQRFPDGISEDGFYQKETPDYFPDWIEQVEVEVKEEGGKQNQVVCGDAAKLVYLGDQACLTLHVWLSRVDDLNHPDKLIFDLDPPGDDFGQVKSAARSLKGILEEVDLASYLMTTGSRGLHVVIPLDREAGFEQVREFARDLSNVLAEREPDNLTTEVRKNKRQGRLFLDYLRNSYAQTSIAPYTLRAKPCAPVAAPLDWEELEDPELNSQSYTLENIFRRLGQKKDPWKDIYRHGRSLTKARELLDKLQENQGG